jgi:hypothetical protein
MPLEAPAQDRIAFWGSRLRMESVSEEDIRMAKMSMIDLKS